MSSLSDPAYGGYSVTPNDSTDNVFDNKCRAVTVLVTGDVAILTRNDEAITINVAAGAPFPIRDLKRIKSTGTTATGIVVLY